MKDKYEKRKMGKKIQGKGCIAVLSKIDLFPVETCGYIFYMKQGVKFTKNYVESIAKKKKKQKPKKTHRS